MVTPLGLKYIPYSYMHPLGMETSLNRGDANIDTNILWESQKSATLNPKPFGKALYGSWILGPSG